MSEEKNESIPRPIDLIKTEYTNVAAQLGQLVFQLAIGEQQRVGLMQQLSNLAKEADAVEKAKKPALAAVPDADGT